MSLFVPAVAALVCAMGCSSAWGAAPARWKENGYAYNARNTPVEKVLADFARSHGVELRAGGTLAGAVPGLTRTPTATEFLDRLAVVHRFQWFVYNQVLYVSPVSDVVMERIEVSTDAVSDAKSALTGVGLFESKFGWGELPEDGAVTVSGPREYVRLVRDVIGQRDRSEDFEAMVFRLKHATVDDRTITVRNQTVVTPGVTSLLKSMLSGKAAPGHALIGPGSKLFAPDKSRGGGASAQSLLDTGEQGGAGGSSLARRSNSPGRSGGAGVSVEGDVRTNSVVIYDLAKRRSYYQRLINAIDLPQQLVEIEAYIIDVNRDRVAELGFGFGVAGSKGGGVIVDPVGALAAPAAGASNLIVASLDRFFSRLRLMEQEGQARVLARPSVLTLENLVAVLDLSQTVYIRATGERVANIEPVTAGMLLRVTPRVVREKKSTQVHLSVDIEDGKVLPGVSGSDTPEVQRSTISTQAVLLDRQSLVIGGYNTDSSSNTDAGVPGLSKVPLLGALFSGTKKLHQSRQRLFILTPRLVTVGVAGGQP